MDLLQAIDARHSVRQYLNKPIEPEKLETLRAAIDKANREGNLKLQLITDEPKAFTGPLAHYGKFSGVTNYIACVGKKSDDLNERIGYYGEQIVLLAQQLGLNTCWVATTVSKRKSAAVVEKGDKIPIIISLGYGATQGHERKTKSAAEVSSAADAPEWFQNGVAAALKAPTALNQQKYMFTLSGNTVTAKATGGVVSDVDLGIVKLHFEIGAGKENFQWG